MADNLADTRSSEVLTVKEELLHALLQQVREGGMRVGRSVSE